jgi:hypothetical protein
MKNREDGGRLIRRPKLTLSSSAEGKDGRNENLIYVRWMCVYCSAITFYALTLVIKTIFFDHT